MKRTVLWVILVTAITACATTLIVLPDLSKFEERIRCVGIHPNVSNVSLERYQFSKSSDAPHNEVALLIVVDPNAKFLQHASWHNGKSTLSKTGFGNLYVSYDNKPWHEVDYKEFLRAMKIHIPSVYLGKHGHVLFNRNHFRCNQ